MLSKKARFILVLISAVAIYQGGKLAWSEVAQSYFDTRCEEDAGEFIYHTVENVEGLFQMRPRDPRDYFSRLSQGDIPEDPYGHTNMEGQNPQSMFLSVPSSRIPIKNSYDFFETIKAPNEGVNFDRRFPRTNLIQTSVITGDKYWLYLFLYNSSEKGAIYEVTQTSELKSKYGFTWREVRNKWDELFGIWGGELIVMKLDTEEIMGVRRGYFYQDYFSRRLTICPAEKGYYPTYDFISKVLKPVFVEDKGEG